MGQPHPHLPKGAGPKLSKNVWDPYLTLPYLTIRGRRFTAYRWGLQRAQCASPYINSKVIETFYRFLQTWEECSSLRSPGPKNYLQKNSHRFSAMAQQLPIRDASWCLPVLYGPYWRANGSTYSDQIWYGNTHRAGRCFYKISHSPVPREVASAFSKFWDSLYTCTEYGKQQTKFCMVIELDVRKIFTRSTTNADVRSVCGS